jgi:hypothetical protein
LRKCLDSILSPMIGRNTFPRMHFSEVVFTRFVTLSKISGARRVRQSEVMR